jgi:threonine/homoserine/homoserine lactone efflux protein
MMPLELFLAYAAAAAIVLVIPGPTITLIIGYALAEGRRAAWATVAGVALGDLTAVTLSLAGLGALLFVAFLPQCVAPGRPALPQLVLLGGTFVVMAALNAAAYAWLAGRARKAISRPSILKAVNRAGGSILIGAGLATVALKRG